MPLLHWTTYEVGHIDETDDVTDTYVQVAGTTQRAINALNQWHSFLYGNCNNDLNDEEMNKLHEGTFDTKNGKQSNIGVQYVRWQAGAENIQKKQKSRVT